MSEKHWELFWIYLAVGILIAIALVVATTEKAL
jgi:hypothetical protein